jgi:hypothetical protein
LGESEPRGAAATISCLRELDMTIPEALTMQVGKKTRYGSRPHPSDRWGYTRQLLDKRGELDRLDALIALFSEIGIDDEISASKWLIVNMKT